MPALKDYLADSDSYSNQLHIASRVASWFTPGKDESKSSDKRIFHTLIGATVNCPPELVKKWHEPVDEFDMTSTCLWPYSMGRLSADVIDILSASESQLDTVFSEIVGRLAENDPTIRKTRISALLQAVSEDILEWRAALLTFEVALRYQVDSALPVLVQYMEDHRDSAILAHCLAYARQFRLRETDKATVRDHAIYACRRLSQLACHAGIEHDEQLLLVNALRTLAVVSPTDALEESKEWLCMNPCIYQVLDTVCALMQIQPGSQVLIPSLSQLRTAVVASDPDGQDDGPSLMALVVEALLLSGADTDEVLNELDELSYSSSTYYALSQGRLGPLHKETINEVFRRAISCLSRDKYYESMRSAMESYIRLADIGKVVAISEAMGD